MKGCGIWNSQFSWNHGGWGWWGGGIIRYSFITYQGKQDWQNSTLTVPMVYLDFRNQQSDHDKHSYGEISGSGWVLWGIPRNKEIDTQSLNQRNTVCSQELWVHHWQVSPSVDGKDLLKIVSILNNYGPLCLIRVAYYLYCTGYYKQSRDYLKYIGRCILGFVQRQCHKGLEQPCIFISTRVLAWFSSFGISYSEDIHEKVERRIRLNKMKKRLVMGNGADG